MKSSITTVLMLLICTVAFAQFDNGQYLLDMAPGGSKPTYSPGLVFSWTNYRDSNFSFQNRWINNYGIGFYGDANGTNAYVSSYFGVDIFTGAQQRFRISQLGSISAFSDMTVTSNIAGTNPDYTWPSNFTVWNNNSAADAFSRITFGTDVAAIGTIAVRKTGTYSGDMYLQVRKEAGNYTTPVYIRSDGNVGIGTLTPGSFKLAVEGKVGAREVNVTTAAWSDYVFEPGYKLPSLETVERYIHENKHLPEVPTAKEVEANGVNVGEMNALLLKKIEELTLYQIESNKQIELLKKEVELLKKN